MLMFLLSSCFGQRTESMETGNDSLVNLSKIKHFSDETVQYFIHSTDGYIYITDGNFLHQLFNDKYLYEIENYNAFLSFLLKNPVNIKLENSAKNYRYYNISFTEDREISAYYKRKGLRPLQKKYCTYKKDKNRLFFKSLPVNTKLTIAYYHWLNGYTYYSECITGDEYLSKDDRDKKQDN